MNERISLNYDTVIYSAGVSGAISSIILKSKGERVLLLNRYGFFGGTISESLNIYQRKISELNENESFLRELIFKFYEDKDGILFEDEEHIILNPEVFKYKLQKFVEASNIDLLFHIIPYRIQFEEENLKLIVLGKEGEIHIHSKRLFDFSTEFTIAPLVDKSSRNFLKSYVNFITLPLIDAKNFDVYRKVKLKDGRFWFSIEHKEINLFSAEEVAQRDFDLFDEMLRQTKSRIQIVPAQSNLIFEFNRSDKFPKNIFFINDFVQSFNHEDELLMANKIEKELRNESNS
ncbi:MAG: FAD-dependent oxidoreductase [Ignavibacteria bacterium]|nr:FAD-dependent oxidoreductase [Ignavibacteria bacterium]